MGAELAKQVKELRESRLKTVCLDLNYAEVTGIIAAVSQHLYNMGWSHLMDDEPKPAPDGFLQQRWYTLYHKASQAQSELASVGHKAEDLKQVYYDHPMWNPNTNLREALADEKNFTLGGSSD